VATAPAGAEEYVTTGGADSVALLGSPQTVLAPEPLIADDPGEHEYETTSVGSTSFPSASTHNTVSVSALVWVVVPDGHTNVVVVSGAVEMVELTIREQVSDSPLPEAVKPAGQA